MERVPAQVLAGHGPPHPPTTPPSSPFSAQRRRFRVSFPLPRASVPARLTPAVAAAVAAGRRLCRRRRPRRPRLRTVTWSLPPRRPCPSPSSLADAAAHTPTPATRTRTRRAAARPGSRFRWSVTGPTARPDSGPRSLGLLPSRPAAAGLGVAVSVTQRRWPPGCCCSSCAHWRGPRPPSALACVPWGRRLSRARFGSESGGDDSASGVPRQTTCLSPLTLTGL